MNAFESGDDVIVDLAAYPDHSIMVQTHRTNMLFGLNPMDAAIPTRYPSAVTCTKDNRLSVSLNEWYLKSVIDDVWLTMIARLPVVAAIWS